MEACENLAELSVQSSESTNKYGGLFSCLPDCILLHILSFLEMKDAVKTSVLSKRWRYLWTEIENLNFHGPMVMFRDRRTESSMLIAKFVQFIIQSLNLHRCSYVKTFRLHFSYQKKYSSYVNSWIRFAIRKKVQKLCLDFPGNGRQFGVLFKLPPWLFQCRSLTELKLSHCIIELPDSTCLSLLRTLSLSLISLDGSLINNVIAGCPLLEDLILEYSGGKSFFNISSSNLQLRHLKLHYCCFLGMEVDAPNLKSLDISGGIYNAGFSLKNLSSLVDACLNFDLMAYSSSGSYVSGAYDHILKKILEGVSHAKVLTLSDWCIKVLSMLELKNIPSPICNCKCLIITTELQKWDLQGIVSLLRGSPELESLTIKIRITWFTIVDPRSQYDTFDDKEYLSSLQDYFPCLVNHLKTVNICDFMGRELVPEIHTNTMRKLLMKLKRELKLATFLLSRAMVLEKVTFHIRNRDFFQSLKRFSFVEESNLGIDQILLNFQRASPHAEIIFSFE